MGDISIPGAPFVITLPDDWTVEIPDTEDVYKATSPYESVTVTYSLVEANSLSEAVEQSGLMMGDFFSLLNITLNGMESAIIYGEFSYPPIVGINIAEYDPEDIGGPPPPFVYEYVIAFVENQDVILEVATSTLLTEQYLKKTEDAEFPEYPEGAPLLIMSGIWPAPRIKVKNPFPPYKEIHPSKIRNKLATSKSFSKFSHAGKQLPVDAHRTEKFGQVPERVRNSNKLTSSIKKLKEISGVLKKDMKYMDVAADLIKIDRIFYTYMNSGEDDKLSYCITNLKEISAILKKDMKYADYAAELIKIYRIILDLI